MSEFAKYTSMRFIHFSSTIYSKAIVYICVCLYQLPRFSKEFSDKVNQHCVKSRVNVLSKSGDVILAAFSRVIFSSAPDPLNRV